MEKVLAIIRERRSLRKFADQPVAREAILTCLEAARLAPSADNIQPWRFVVLDDPEVKEAFGKEAFSGIYRVTRWAVRAPVIVVLLAELNVFAHRMGKAVQGTPFYLLDLGIAGEHVVLQAQAMGLGTCWIGWFDAKRTKKFLGIPGRVRVCGLLAVGYPLSGWQPKLQRRKKAEEIVFFNAWGGE